MRTYLLRILPILAALIFCGCKKEEGKVEIQILNKEVHSLDKEFKGDFYFTNEEIKKSQNIIRFKLINNTDYKQILVFNPFDSALSNLMPEVKGANGEIKKYSPGIRDFFNDPEYIAYSNCMLNTWEDITVNYKNMGIKEVDIYMDYRQNNILLYPGEERIIETIIYLPLLSAYYNRFASGSIKFYGIKEYDLFCLTYKTYPLRYKRSLPDWELKQLNDKNILFYDDTIRSNYIPIKLIK